MKAYEALKISCTSNQKRFENQKAFVIQFIMSAAQEGRRNIQLNFDLSEELIDWLKDEGYDVEFREEFCCHEVLW